MKKLVMASVIASVAIMLGCGGGSGSGGSGGGPQPGSVSVTVTPSSTVNLAITFTQQFTASVTGSSNTAVTWSVAGSGCSGSACGTISSSGLYTAPSSIPSSPTVTVTATSMADSTKSATGKVKIVGISVGVVPATATVALNGTQQFSAQVSPASGVTWSITGAGCSGAACGTMDSSGNYTGPATLPSPATVTVTATSNLQSSSSSKATVSLVSSFNSRLKGQFAFRFTGFDASGPVYSAGIFSGDGAGNITNGTEDVNRTSGVQKLTFTGTYAVQSDNRGQMTITDSIGGTYTYDFAVGSSGETLFTELDNSGTRGGGIFDKADSSAFSNAKIKGTYVMNLAGSDVTSGRVGAVGEFVTDGAGNVTSGSIDVNDAGSAQSSPSLSGTYSVASTGRGTIAASIQGATANFAFYIVSVNELFIVSTDAPGASNRVVGLAYSQDQTVAPYSNSSLNASAVFDLTGLQATSSVVAIGEIVPANGSLTGTFDENNAGSITPAGGQLLSGTYTVAATGRATLSLTGTNPPASSLVAYLFGNNTAFLLDISSSSVLTGKMQAQTPGSGGVFSASTIQGTFVEGTITQADAGASSLSGVLRIDGVKSLTGTQDQSTPSTNSMGQSVAGTYTVAASGRGTAGLSAPSSQNWVVYVVSNGLLVAIDVDATNAHAAVISAAR